MKDYVEHFRNRISELYAVALRVRKLDIMRNGNLLGFVSSYCRRFWWKMTRMTFQNSGFQIELKNNFVQCR